MGTFAEADARALEILDKLQVTEFEYHDGNYTRPLVSLLLHLALNHLPGEGRVLLVGPNPFLCHCLLEQGFEIEVWTYRQRPFTESLISYVRADIGPDELAAAQFPPSDGPYDLIVLPLILETLTHDLRPILCTLHSRLLTDGGLAVATTNLVKLGTRWRACLGRDFLPLPKRPAPLRLGGWHRIAAKRYYSLEELNAYTEETGFTIRDIVYTVGYRPFDDQRPLGPASWTKAKLKYWSRNLLPSLRDYVVMFWERKE